MQDFEKLYNRERRKNIVLLEKIQRVWRVMASDLPKDISLFAIALILKRAQRKHTKGRKEALKLAA